MDENIKKLHKIVYRAMEFQYHNYDFFKRIGVLLSIITITFSILLLISDKLTTYLRMVNIPLELIEFLFFLINLVLVITSICWIYISTKYDTTTIGITAESLKDIQYKIKTSSNYAEAKTHFDEYIEIKPQVNDLFLTDTKTINKRLKRSGKDDYLFSIEEGSNKKKWGIAIMIFIIIFFIA